MSEPNNIVLFEEKYVRRVWDEKSGKWYFSVVDAVGILTDSENPRRYWSDLKRKLTKEGYNELYEKIVQLKMQAPDGKERMTDSADAQTLLRIIQSIPSPKAEPFKRWLAKVGYERMQEIEILIENTVTKRIDSLFDGYKLTHEKQWELERKVEQLEKRLEALEIKTA